MIINSTLIFCLVPELKDALVGLRIASVYTSSDQKELFFSLRGRNGQKALYFSTHAQNCRVEIWEGGETERRKGFQKSNLFWFSVGGYVRKVEQLDFDRVIEISGEKKTQFGAGEAFDLIFELTGKNANLVLVKADRRIVDCLRKVDATRSSFRQILPGGEYLPPPAPKKRSPFPVKKEEFGKLVKSCNRLALDCLTSRFMGMDEFLSRNIVAQSQLDPKKKGSQCSHDEIELLAGSFCKTFEQISVFNLDPQIVIDENGNPTAISCLDLAFVRDDRKIHCDSLNSAVRTFFSLKLEREKRNREIHRLSLITRRALKKLTETAAKIEGDHGEARAFEQYKRFGDLLMMNKQTIRKGQTAVELTDVFAPEPTAIEIPLDPKLSVIGNAQRYFKRYRKAKDALKIIQRRRSETEKKMSRLHEISGQLKKAGEQVDLEGIKCSLMGLGFPAGETGAEVPKSSIKEKKIPFRVFLTDRGTEILVGRNNKENDYLTFKFARPDDLWFHAQDVPGSHVLLKRKDKKTEPLPEQIRQAAKVAAHFSKARNEKKAAVIYTQAKYVRKPRKGKPGLALAEREKAILVEPGLPKKSSGKL